MAPMIWMVVLGGLWIGLLTGVNADSSPRDVVGSGPETYNPAPRAKGLEADLMAHAKTGWAEGEILRSSAQTVHGQRLLGDAPITDAAGLGLHVNARAAAPITPQNNSDNCPAVDPGKAIPPPVPPTPTCPEGYQWTQYPDEQDTECVQIACNTASSTTVKSYFSLISNRDNTYSYPSYIFNVRGFAGFTYGILFQEITFSDKHVGECTNYFAKNMDDTKLLERFEPKTQTKIETFCNQAPDPNSGFQLQFCSGMPARTPTAACP